MLMIATALKSAFEATRDFDAASPIKDITFSVVGVGAAAQLRATDKASNGATNNAFNFNATDGR